MTETSTAAATPSTAVATQDRSVSGVVQTYRDDFAAVLPSHVKPDTWVRLAVGALRRDVKLREAAENDLGALMNALLHAARLGLEPGTEQYYLTPRKDKGVMKVAGVVGYQGEIELMYRAGAISSVIVEVVREKDTFDYVPGRDERPLHTIDWDVEDRGDLRLVYAYAVMKDGATSKVVVLNRGHIATAKANSQGADSPYSPWVKHPEAMWMKTAAHRLAKWVPTSAEYMREQLRAVAAVAAETGQPVSSAAIGHAPSTNPAPLPPLTHVDTSTGEIIDAEVADPDAPDWARQ
jgi:recombination protein RecT